MAYGIFYFFASYVIVLAIFVFCYGKILMEIRRQESAMSAYPAAGSSNNKGPINQMRSGVIKTMN